MFKRIIIISLIILIFIIGGFIYFLITQKPVEEFPVISKEKTAEEILQNLTVPSAEANSQRSQEIMDNLTDPIAGKREISADIIKKLTAPK